MCRVRDLKAGEDAWSKPLAEIKDFNWHVFLQEASPDGDIIVVEGLHRKQGEPQRFVAAFDSLTGDKLWTRRNDRDEGVVLRIDPGGKWVFVGTDHTSGILLDLRTGREQQRMQAGTIGMDARHVVRMSPFELFERNRTTPIMRFGIGSVNAFGQSRFSRSGRHFASAYDDSSVVVYDLITVHQRLQYLGIAPPGTALKLGPAGQN